MRDLPRSLDAAAGPHVVNFFRWLKRGLKANIALLNDVETYCVNRTRFNQRPVRPLQPRCSGVATTPSAPP